MAPLPITLTTTVRAPSSSPIGGNESALSVNTLLAFGAVLLAAMQGTLVMESADPCRISYKKWKLLVILEALEVGVVVASEVFSFIDLRAAFRVRLQWLHWLPPCLLTVGLLELLIDLWWTLWMGIGSRMEWTPFSTVGYVDKDERKSVRSLFEVVPMMVTAILSLVLVGWRMRWWLVHTAVGERIAQQAAITNGALSNGALGFCVGWGLLLSVVTCVLIFLGELTLNFDDDGKLSYQTVFGGFMGSWNPRKYFVNHPNQYWRREPKEEEIETYDKLYEMQHGMPSELEQKEKKRNLQTAEPHIGNAILLSNNSEAFNPTTPSWHVGILLVEHFTILPLQCCVVVAVVQLRDKLDQPTFNALKELVNAVVVVALVELAIGFKAWLWGYAYVDEVHNNDRTLGEPLSDVEEKGCLRG